MDQKTPTNGTGNDKRNWRDRLGIGSRDMPRISDEFRAAEPPPVERTPSRPPQPVTRPAPMAPRVAVKQQMAEPSPRQPAQNSGQAPSPLEERLKAQRAAAEKLAVQRVSAARERAEAKQAPEASPPAAARANPTPAAKAVHPAAGKPKFTFAEEEFVNARKDAAPPPIQPPIQPILRQGGTAVPPLTPPRPAPGGERTQAPLLRPAAAQPQFRADPPPVYRPVDPATGYTGARSRPLNLESGATGYGSRVAARRGAYDPYRRGPDAAGFEPSIHPDEARDPRAARPLAARGRPAPPPPEDDYGDEFEDELPPPRHRASASEYNSAYRDVEESYRDDQRRSNGPWLLLLALLLVAAAAGGGIWLYQTKFKSVAGPAATDTVPVVAAPEGAAKTAAEVPADPVASTASKKKIYDRIVGDQEVTEEQMAPAEGTPLQPEPQQAGEDNPPLTDSGVLTDESNPLPLPPPPTESDGTQGNAGQPATRQSAEAKPEDVQRVIANPVATTDNAAAMMPATGEPEPLPPPEPSMEQMAAKAAAPVSAEEPVPAKPAATDTALSASPAEEQAAATETVAPAPPVKKKAAATPKKKKPAAAAAAETSDATAESVVLIPPSQSADIVPPSQGGSLDQVSSEPAVQAPAKTKKKRTLMDLFGNKEASTSETPAAPVNEQVASLPDPVPDATPSAASGGSGYVVQLASFRSEAEAQAEYSRLASKHSGIVGSLPSRVSQAKVSGSTRYRLGLGPLASREEASKVCSSLVAAGERDCLVRRQ